MHPATGHTPTAGPSARTGSGFRAVGEMFVHMAIPTTTRVVVAGRFRTGIPNRSDRGAELTSSVRCLFQHAECFDEDSLADKIIVFPGLPVNYERSGCLPVHSCISPSEQQPLFVAYSVNRAAALMALSWVLPVVWLPPTVTVPSRRIGSEIDARDLRERQGPFGTSDR